MSGAIKPLSTSAGVVLPAPDAPTSGVIGRAHKWRYRARGLSLWAELIKAFGRNAEGTELRGSFYNLMAQAWMKPAYWVRLVHICNMLCPRDVITDTE